MEGASSPQRPLCDVCTKDRVAIRTCIDCKQKFCLPCRKNHDAFKLFEEHTVVCLTQEEEEECGKGDPLSGKGKDKQEQKTLKDMLASVTQQMKKTDHLIVSFNEAFDKLHQEQQKTEHSLKDHTDMLYQSLRRELDNTIANIRSKTNELETSLQDEVEKLENRNVTLRAQQVNLIRTLKEEKEIDIAYLQNSILLENVDVKQTESLLTKDMAVFVMEPYGSTINRFLCVLGSIQKLLSPGETAISMQLARRLGSIPVDRSRSISADRYFLAAESSSYFQYEGSPSMGRRASFSANLRVDETHKKPPRVFKYSEWHESYVTAMCPIGENQLWVMCTPADKNADDLKMFDARGRVLIHVEDIACWCSGLIPIAEGIALSWRYNRNSIQLIRHDGSITAHDLGFKVEYLASSAVNEYQYLKKIDDSKLSRVTFGFLEDSQTDNFGAPPQESLGRPQLTCRDVDIVFDKTPPGRLVHVSAEEEYFVFEEAAGDNRKLKIYTRKSGRRSYKELCAYTPDKYIVDVRFWRVDRHHEVLLVAMSDDNKIHVLNYTERGSPVLHLDTTPMNLYRPERLAIGCDQQVYIGCEGGKVVVIDP